MVFLSLGRVALGDFLNQTAEAVLKSCRDRGIAELGKKSPVDKYTKGSRTRRKSAKVVTMSLEGGGAPHSRQLVTAWGCGADPPL